MPRRPQLPAFALALRPSRIWLALVLLALAASTAVVLAYLPWPLATTLPLQALLALWALRANGWWAPAHCPRGLTVDAFGALTLHYPAQALPAQVQDDSFVTPWLTVLNVKVDGRRRSVMLWPDSAAADGRRQLRVYLLWFAAPLAEELR